MKRHLGQVASTASPLHSHSEQEVQIPPTNHHPSKEFVLVHQHKSTEFRCSHCAFCCVFSSVRVETCDITQTEETSCKRNRSNAAPCPLAEFSCIALRVSLTLGLVDPPIRRRLFTGHAAELRWHMLPDSGRSRRAYQELHRVQAKPPPAECMNGRRRAKSRRREPHELKGGRRRRRRRTPPVYVLRTRTYTGGVLKKHLLNQ